MSSKWTSLLAIAATLGAGCASDPSVTGFEPTLPPPNAAIVPGLRALIDELTLSVREAPDDPDRHGRLGLAYEANLMMAEAEASYRQATQLDGTGARWFYRLGRVVYEEDRTAAIRAFRQAVARRPDHAPAWYQLGNTLLELGRIDEAESAFRQTVRHGPSYAQGHIGLGQVALERGDADAAVEQALRALSLDPANRETHHTLGLAYREIGRMDEARIELTIGKEALMLPIPDGLDAEQATYMRALVPLLATARALLNRGDARRAVELLQPAVFDHPRSVDLRRVLGGALVATGRFREAQEVLEAALADAPDDPGTLLNLGECRGQTGDYSGALSLYEQILRADPRHRDAHLGRGRALMALGRAPEAVRALEDAVAADPANGRTRLFLGQTYLALGRRDEGLREVREAVERDPGSLETQVGGAETLLAFRDRAGAIAAIVGIRRLAPTHPQLAKLERASGQ